MPCQRPALQIRHQARHQQRMGKLQTALGDIYLAAFSRPRIDWPQPKTVQAQASVAINYVGLEGMLALLV